VSLLDISRGCVYYRPVPVSALGGAPGEKPELRITSRCGQGPESLVVRANAELNQQSIVDPKQYQDFFAALEKAMFPDRSPGRLMAVGHRPMSTSG